MIDQGRPGTPPRDAFGDLVRVRNRDDATHSLRRSGLAAAVVPAADGVAAFDGARLVLWAWGAIDLTWADEAAAALDRWPAAQAVILRINSHGGQHLAAEFVHKRLRQHRGRTIAVVDQACHSAAAIVAAGCDLTWMRKGATWMVHRVRIAVDGDSGELSRAAFDAREIDAQVARKIAGRRGLAFELVRELRDSARFVPADEAVRLGLADRVIHGLPVRIGLADRVIHSLPIAQEGNADVIATSPR